MTDTQSIESARATLGDIVDRARMTGQATTITRHGRAAARIVPLGIQPPAGRQVTATPQRIIQLIGSELAQLPTLGSVRPLSPGWRGTHACYISSASRAAEIAVFAELSDALAEEIEEDALTGSRPLDEDEERTVREITQRQVGSARYQIESYVWPAPTADLVQLIEAAGQLYQLNALRRLVEILTYTEDGVQDA